MSNLKQFTSKIENVSTGEFVSAIPSDETFYTSLGYLKCDGSIVSQNTYSAIFQHIGLFRDNLGVVSNVQFSNTSTVINDVTYANGIFVYAGDTIATSSNGYTWTTRVTNDAPTYVGGKTFSRTGNTSTATVSLTDLTGGVASAPATGDIVFIAISIADGDALATSQAGPSGYTTIASLSSTDIYVTHTWIGYKIMGTTADTTVGIPRTGEGNGAVDRPQTVAIQVWRDAAYVSDSQANTATGINTVVANPPAITTISNNNVLLVIGAGASSNANTYTASYLSNFSSISQLDSSGGSNWYSVIGMGSITRTERELYDPAAFTFTGTDSSSFSYTSATIALRPSFANRIIQGGDSFVYAGTELATSPNAISWTTRTSGTTNEIKALTYANGTYVYAGSSGVLATSPNAVTWTARTSGTSNNINALAYGNGIFVYAGEDGVVATSPNAVTWTTQTAITAPILTYVGGKTAVRDAAGTTSVSLTDLTGGVASAPAAGDVVFVAYGTATQNSTPTTSAPTGFTSIAALNAVEAATDYSTGLSVSYRVMGATPNTTVTIPAPTVDATDAQAIAIQVWRNVHPNIFDTTSTTATAINTILANPPSITTTKNDSVLLVIAAGAHIANSGQTYTASYLSNFLTTTNDNTLGDAVIGFGSIERPTAGAYDPAAWTFSAADSTTYSYAAVTIAIKPLIVLNELIYTNNTFIVSGNNGVIKTSTDGSTWTTVTSGTSNNINALLGVNDPSFYLYGGDSGTLASSSNTVTWTARSSNTISNISGLANGNGVFVFTGTDGTIGLYLPYTYDYITQFRLPTLKTANSYFDLYIKT